jgi:hypothetical protein
MAQFKLVVKAGIGVFLLLWTSAFPSFAQSTNARPVLLVGAADADLVGNPWLNDEGRQAAKEGIADLNAGNSVVHVMASALDGKSWASRAEGKKDFVSLEDLARRSLEACEYFGTAPCFIVAINGRDARDAAGGFPIQPRMLTREGGTLDLDRIPFVTARDRVALRSYINATGSKALMVTSPDGWLWRAGDTAVQAIATAASDCAKTYANQTCVLYAVNDRVVLAR